MKTTKKVVTNEWVDEVIETMGTPEDFMEAEGDEEETFQAKRKRRLYRDPDNRVIGGVCGGLGAYFNMDPVILRIIMVVLFLLNGIGLLAYLVLWIAVPKARTTAQRLEMRGQEATVKNIEKSIKEEVKEVKESYKKFKESDSYAKGKKSAAAAGDVFYNIFKVILKVFVVIIGVFLILSGFFGLLGYITSMIVGHSFVEGWPILWGPEFHIPGVLNHFISESTLTIGMILIGLLVGIPFLAMLFIGTKLVFRYKSNNTAIGLSMLGVWLIALFALIIVSASQVGNFKSRASLSKSETLNCESCETLYLEINDKEDDYTELDLDMNGMKVAIIDGEEVMVGEPRFDIEKASIDNFVLVIKTSSRGKTRDQANESSKQVVYEYQVVNSTLLLDPYFSLGEDGKFRDQEVDITLKVPEGKAVYLNDNMISIIHDIDNVSNTWDGDMVGKYWEMTPEGLALQEDK